MTIRIQGHKLEYTDKAYRTMGYKCCPDCGNWFKPPEKFKARILCVKCQSYGRDNHSGTRYARADLMIAGEEGYGE